MGHWDELRGQARRERATIIAQAQATGLLPSGQSLLSTDQLLRLTEEVTGVPRVELAADDPLLYGALAWLGGDAEDRVIYYGGGGGWQVAFYQAHEFAHLWLHHTHENAACGPEDVEPEASESSGTGSADRVQGYGPRERREREANLFAREFLLPADVAAHAYLHDNLNLSALSDVTGLPASLVAEQLAYGLLTPLFGGAKATPAAEGPAIALDPSQARAAYTMRGPILVEAGPGTGKTRTLVSRVLYLLGQGVPPAAILALTFSNRAAEEMRTRIAAVAPAAAPLIPIFTFHAFGLELLRKHGTRIGLPPQLALLDPVDAIIKLETSIDELGLDHYLNLYEPSLYLRDILRAISRAKDELKGPAEYRALAEAMLERAATEEEQIRAEKAREVANVYAFYEEHLAREGIVDLGDLIFKSVELLRSCPDVRSNVRLIYAHILVDEYQDVNRASGLLLREVAGDGAGLWAVGDARQAIYRFRGAAPINMALFPEDFPGAQVMPLEVNYRSQPPIVALFGELAGQMAAPQSGNGTSTWQPRRALTDGNVSYQIAPDEPGEIDLIATEITRQHAAGLSYRDQAILCRSHGALERIAEGLSARGVPVLYLGDIFEREEVRDLLALLSLATGDGMALLRVGTFPDYEIPRRDIMDLLQLARERDERFPQALRLADHAPEISPAARAGFARLYEHMRAAVGGDGSAWSLLARYMFGPAAYLRLLLAARDSDGQQRRLAVFQLLQFALEQRQRAALAGGDQVRYLLDYIRRLQMIGEARDLRQVPDWAEGLDAVRLLTVHAAKGLEFSAVYLPRLSTGNFPPSGKAEPCPPPDGLIEGESEDRRAEEEECLFFVALSRARDHLNISRALRYGSMNRTPSSLLGLIKEHLPDPPFVPKPIKAVADPTDAALPAADGETLFDLASIETYMRCPRRFYYAHVLNLASGDEEAAYVRFNRCVRHAITWVRDEQKAGREVDSATAAAQLDTIWAESGPREHAHEALYLDQARLILARTIHEQPAGADVTPGRGERPRWQINLSQGSLHFKPDQAELVDEPDGQVLRLRRLRTGRPSKGEKDNEVYALYHSLAAEAFPKARVAVQVVYLTEGQVEEIELSQKQIDNRLDKYNAALAGIRRADFAPRPSDRECPRCPFYFICPQGGEI